MRQGDLSDEGDKRTLERQKAWADSLLAFETKACLWEAGNGLKDDALASSTNWWEHLGALMPQCSTPDRSVLNGSRYDLGARHCACLAGAALDAR